MLFLAPNLINTQPKPKKKIKYMGGNVGQCN